ncbi:MAG: 50S ribosomal protein L23 [Methylococcales bacterium]
MKRNDLMNVVQSPVVSEKSTNAAEIDRQFVFRVEKSANKLQIKKAVELMFEVEVQRVTTLNVIGKTKRMGRSVGKRSDWKKAYVKLKPGFDIEFSSV